MQADSSGWYQLRTTSLEPSTAQWKWTPQIANRRFLIWVDLSVRVSHIMNHEHVGSRRFTVAGFVAPTIRLSTDPDSSRIMNQSFFCEPQYKALAQHVDRFYYRFFHLRAATPAATWVTPNGWALKFAGPGYRAPTNSQRCCICGALWLQLWMRDNQHPFLNGKAAFHGALGSGFLSFPLSIPTLWRLGFLCGTFQIIP